MDINRDTYLSQFEKDPSKILGKRVLPPRGIPQLFQEAALLNREYGSPEEMAHSIELYFDRFPEELDDNPKKHPTMAGLARALGFSSKARLQAYEENYPEYTAVIELARTILEDYKNNFLLRGGSITAAFALDLKNNHGWADKVETKSAGPSDTLAELVRALQGNVHRPKICYDEAVEAEYEEYDSSQNKDTEDKYDLI